MRPIEESLNKLKGPQFSDDLELKSSGYRLKGTLGQGNFAEVKKALHIDTNIEVAVKNLDKYKMVDNDDTQRVNREIQILGKLNHPHISFLYEVRAK
jgi:MAP/microtubule affinity-regulating kinase